MASLPVQIGKYRILGLIGRGGMGAVYKAEDPGIGRLVAIKVLLTEFEDEDMLKRFYSEARATGGLQHPNIVTLHDLGETEGSPYLVMQFLDGEALDKVIASRQLSILEILDIVSQVCSGLHYAHGRQVIHRDVKSANVVLLPDGIVKIVDFGIAKFGNDRQTRTGMAIGSVKYMSPEQIAGANVDHRTDVYSAGVLLYELLTRQLPFEGADIVSTMHKVLNAPPPQLIELIPDRPARLEEILQKALAKKPEDRYQTAEEFGYDLSDLRDQLKRESIADHILQVKRSIAAKQWSAAGDQLEIVRRLDQQSSAVRELSREIRIFSEPRPAEELIPAILEVATRAESQRRYDDVLRLCDRGLEIAPENAELLRLRDAALAGESALAPEGATQLFAPQTGIAPGLSSNPTIASTPRISPAAPVESAGATSGLAHSAPKPGSSSKRLWTASAAMVLIVAAGGAAYLLHSRPSRSNSAPPAPAESNATPAARPAATPGSASSVTPTSGVTPASDTRTAETNSTAIPVEVTAASAAETTPSDTADWSRLQKSATTADLDSFLAKYPRSSLRAAAEQKREDLVWNRAQADGSPQSLSNYLTQYPAGKYALRARQQIVGADQKSIDTATDIPTLESFLAKYPLGDMHTRVLARLDDAVWSHTGKDTTALTEYLKAFPTGRHSAEAHTALRAIPAAPAAASVTSPRSVAIPTAPADHPAVDDKTLILSALADYEQAYDRQDIDGIHQVWPDIPDRTKKAMQDVFGKVKSTHLTEDVLSGPDISGSAATVKLSQTVVFSLGGGPQSKSDKVTMDLRKRPSSTGQDKWYIEAMR